VSRTIEIIQADVFTERPFAGNPAAAVLDADGLDAPAMQRIAAEMLVPGTAFVSASAQAGVDWRLRMFTPKREVGYSGHTALCGTHALVESGRLAGDRVTYETPAGLLRVDVERGAARARLWLEPPLPACRPFEGDLGEILDALGLARAAVAGWARPAVTPDQDLLLPVRDLAALRALEPDMRRLAVVRAPQHARGVCVVSRETVDPGSRSHCRFFAPHYGIPEDIVTGSVHSALGVWLLEAGALPGADGRIVFTAEQGDGLGRPGRLQVELEAKAGHATRVRVGGSAITVLTGRLRADA
jgi:trans-2,3-dihydro-3-hydroxyanthranilate isomerase